MPIVVNKNGGGGNFTPHPQTQGTSKPIVRGVIVDVTDPVPTPTKFGTKDTFQIVIESEIDNPERPGEKFCVWSPRLTPSFNEKATLRKFLKDAFGRDVVETDCDASGNLDVESFCLGHPVEMIIRHETQDDKVYANIAMLMPATANPLKPSGTFKRKKDRPERGAESEKERAGVTKPAQTGAATAHYGVSKPDWRKAIIPAGSHAGKHLEQLTHDELKAFLPQYIDWCSRRSSLAPENQILLDACREATAFLIKADPEDDINF